MSPDSTKRFPGRRAPLKRFGQAVAAGLVTAGCASAQTIMPHPIVLGSPAHISGTGPEMTTGFSAPAMEEHALHLLVGHSIFVNTKHRLARVYVTNPTVLDSYTANPNQIVVTAKTTGVGSLIIWDEDGDSQVYMVSADSDVEGLRTALSKAMPDLGLEVKASEGRITLSGVAGTQEIADNAMKIASMYGKDVSNAIVINSARTRQVRLKVRFVVIDRSRATQFGLNIFGLAGETLFQTTTGQFSSNPQLSNVGGGSGGTSLGGTSITYTDPLNFLIYSAKYNVGLSLKDLQNKQILQILAEPTITTKSGQKANFLAGGEFPFPVVQGSAQGGTSVSIQFRPFGVKLDFLPVVNTDGTIDLTVMPEVSALDYANAVTISGFTIPALSTRRASTDVVLRSGQSFAISGLLDRRTTNIFGRTPGIASIPIIGELFKSKSLTSSMTELLVIVTPEIVDPLKIEYPYTEPVAPLPYLDKEPFDRTVQQKTAKEKQ